MKGLRFFCNFLKSKCFNNCIQLFSPFCGSFVAARGICNKGIWLHQTKHNNYSAVITVFTNTTFAAINLAKLNSFSCFILMAVVMLPNIYKYIYIYIQGSGKLCSAPLVYQYYHVIHQLTIGRGAPSTARLVARALQIRSRCQVIQLPAPGVFQLYMPCLIIAFRFRINPVPIC